MKDYTPYAILLATQALVTAIRMVEENTNRRARGEAPAYSEEEFVKVEDDLQDQISYVTTMQS